MSFVVRAPRAREHRDRPVVVSLRDTNELTELTAKIRAAALPLLDLSGCLPVMSVDGLPAGRVVDDLAALRTLRRARFALNGLRSAGVGGAVTLRSGERAGQVDLTLLNSAARLAPVRLSVQADRNGAPLGGGLGGATLSLGHSTSDQQVCLTTDPASVRRELVTAVMDATCQDAWREAARREGRGLGVVVRHVDSIDRTHSVFDLEMAGPDDDVLVRVGLYGTGRGTSVIGLLRWGHQVPPRGDEDRTLRLALGAPDLGDALLPFVHDLHETARRLVGLPHMALV